MICSHYSNCCLVSSDQLVPGAEGKSLSGAPERHSSGRIHARPPCEEAIIAAVVGLPCYWYCLGLHRGLWSPGVYRPLYLLRGEKLAPSQLQAASVVCWLSPPTPGSPFLPIITNDNWQENTYSFLFPTKYQENVDCQVCSLCMPQFAGYMLRSGVRLVHIIQENELLQVAPKPESFPTSPVFHTQDLQEASWDLPAQDPVV